MKKYFYLLIIILLLCSCGKKEYKVIEISSYDLIEAIKDNNGNFVFGIYNSDYENDKAFLSDLKTASDRAGMDIYYIDYKHATSDSASYLVYDIGYNSSNGQYYGVFENGKIINSGYYSDFNSMYEKIFKSKYNTDIKKTSSDDEDKYIEDALKLYEDNKYNSALDTLNHAWPNNKAKSIYKQYKYFKLSGIWESYSFLGDDHKKVDFYAFYFLSNNDNYCLMYSIKNQVYDGFKKPSFGDLNRRYYYIKDDIIYMSNKDDGSYEPYYKIEFINDIDMKLLDLKNKNKEINFQRRD